jgi:hypothetical protein
MAILIPSRARSFQEIRKRLFRPRVSGYAEKGRPRFEMKPFEKIGFSVVRSFCACSFGISRPRIVLLSLNLQGFRSACESSQM